MAQWRARLGLQRKPRVGLVWSGNPLFPDEDSRSVALPAGFEYVSLKKEVTEQERATLALRADIVHLGDELQDFMDTAALCELVDVVISTCTSVAHLAGSMGRPLWVLLTYNTDWRWLRDRTDSPWYPSARLYRQDKMGDWSGVSARVRADLERQIE